MFRVITVVLSFTVGAAIINPSVASAAVSSGDITSFTPVCVGAPVTYPAETDEDNAETTNPGHNYQNLLSAPNPRWFYLKIKDAGQLNIAQTNSNGVDVDGALWGPFNDIPDMLRDGSSEADSYLNVLDSDFLPAPGFQFSAPVLADKYYVLLVANFSGTNTNISLDSGTGTTATTDCDMLNPGFDISLVGTSLDTTEAGATQTYEINLYGQPTHDVTVNITTANGEVTPNVTPLLFSLSDWYIRQTVTVSAVDDLLVDGVQNDDVINTGSSTDSDYNNLARSIPAIARDNDVPPVPTIAMDNVTADNAINAAEAEVDVSITGTVGGDFTTGDTVTLVVNGNTFTGVVNAAGVYSIDVPGADLVADTTIDASILASDAAGNTGSTSVTPSHTVDTTDPIPTIAVDNVTADNTISAAETDVNVAVTGTVGGEFTAGDTVTLEVDGNTYTGVVDGAGAYSIDIPGADLAADTTIDASVSTSDAAGNTGVASVTPTHSVDTTDPIPTIAVNSITADNTINATEAGVDVAVTGTVAGEFNAGDTVTLLVNGNSYTGVVGPAGVYNIDVAGSDLVADTTIDASVTTTDAAGNAGSASVAPTHNVDTTDPMPTIVVDSVTADNVINAAEASVDIAVTGTVAGEFNAGDTVTLVVNDNTYTGVVGPAGVYSIDVAGSDLVADTTIDASVTTTDTAGNTGSASVESTHNVDTTDPIPTIAVNSVTADNAINAAEADVDVAVTGTIAGEFNTGDTVTLVINGNTYTGVVDAAGAYSIDVAGADLVADTTIDASVTTTDAAGNAGSASVAPTHNVDTTDPIPTIVVDSVTPDNAINATEAGVDIAVIGTVAGEFNAGDTVTLVINGNIYTGVVDAAGAYSIDVAGADLVADTTIDASVTTNDAAGNSGSASVEPTHNVDTTDPIPTIAVNSVTADNAINAAEADVDVTVTGTVAGEFNTGDTVSLVVNGNTYTGVVDGAGVYSIDIAGSDLVADTTIDASVTTTDTAGNTGSASVTPTHSVDTTDPIPTIAVSSVTADNAINAAEAGVDVAVIGTVAGEFNAGDTVTLLVNGNTYTGVVDAAGAYSIDVAGSDLVADTTIDASVTTTDAAGNAGSASVAPTHNVDTTDPIPTIVVDSVTADNVINAAEASVDIAVTGTVSGEFNTGDTVTLLVNGNAYTGVVDGVGVYSIDVAGSDLVADTTIDAGVTTTDTAGNTGSASVTPTHNVDATDPVPTIAVNSVTADNSINAAESGSTVPVTGTVSGEFNTGDTVTLLVNGNTYTGVVDVTGGFSVSVAGADLAADTTIDASVETTDVAGNAGSAATTATHIVDTDDPAPTIAVNSVTADNAINAAEAGANVDVSGVVAGEFSAGDTVTLVVDGNAYTGVVDVAGAYSISVPGVDLAADTTIDASVATTDASGNPGSATTTVTYTVDTATPVPTIVVDSVTADNVINAAESSTNIDVTGTVAGEFVAGDTVTLLVNGNTYAGIVDAAGAYSISVPGMDLAADATIDAGVATTDAAGNQGSATTTPTHTVDIADPIPTIVVDSVTTDNAINAAEAGGDVAVTGEVAGEFNAGDIVTLVVNGNTYTGVVDAAGVYSIDVAGADLVADTTIDASVESTDAAGNTGSMNATATHIADVTAETPTVSITEDTSGDGFINTAELIGSADVSVLLPADAMTGDTITVTDGTTVTAIVLTAADITEGAVAASFVAPADGDTLNVSATLTDAVGNVSEEASDSAIIDTTEALLTAADIGPIPDTTPTLTGTTDQPDGSTVVISDSAGNELCTAIVAAAEWTCDSTVELSFGTNNLVAETIDSAGNTAITPFTAILEIDTDSDGLSNSVDLDDDNDGIPDLLEEAGDPNKDTDGDGIIDSQDLDSDNDGVGDIIEAGGVDADTDGLVDNAVDTDGDGLADSVDANPLTADSPIDAITAAAITALPTTDTDQDGTPDFQDVDSDNDGIPDVIEGNLDSDEDGLPDAFDPDSDNDGIPDSAETAISGIDTDGDGIDDTFDVDATGGIDNDGDGVDDAAAAVGATDTDGDGIADSIDPDSDNDGIPDALEGNGDADDDGIPDNLDTDSDNDGIPDSVEAGVSGVDSDGDGIDDTFDVDETGGVDTDTDGVADAIEAAGTMDTDGDGVPDSIDPDADGDGVPDSMEGTGDADYDGIPDNLDTDSDNDGIPDSVEAGVSGVDSDGDGIDDTFDVDETGGVDTDGDGVSDAIEADGPTDTDGDGVPDSIDSDADGDGIPDTMEGTGDADNDGIPNNLDTDSDNDGILDSDEALQSGIDSDGDGIDDTYDVDVTGGLDVDNDGVDDAIEEAGPADSDGDDIPDTIDTDADGDGIPDAIEGLLDSDGDGITDNLDTDSDNDGIPDSLEAQHSGVDSDGDGIDDTYDVDITGGVDADQDGVDDAIESAGPSDSDGDGLPDHLDGDADGDGIPDVIEGAGDADGDGILDFVDEDSDNDGIPDAEEDTTTPPLSGVDSDFDGIDDAIDVDVTGGADTDGNGIDDEFEPTDFDGDGIPDNYDSDSDNDGIEDTVEGTADTDDDGVPDFLDLDSDDDGILDSIETAIDTDGDGVADFVDIDADNDGISDALELAEDSDADGVKDFRDLDVDNDGIFDLIEARVGLIDVNLIDADNDGVVDMTNAYGANGMADVVETAPDSGEENYELPDIDNDGVLDFRDLDTDNDGLLDTNESDHEDSNLNGLIDTVGVLRRTVLAVDATGLGADAGGLPRNTDSDDVADFRDADSDNDGIMDLVESFGPVDLDNDGMLDDFVDANGDGIDDVWQSTPLLPADTDGDGVTDSVEIDADGDGIADIIESGGVDADGDGMLDDFTDSNSDGVDDTVAAVPGVYVDTDGDGQPDFQDLDSDNDGESDVIEAGGVDTNGDGFSDELLIGSALIDTNGDGVADFQQVGNVRTGLDGSGCTVNPNAKGDPTLPLLALFSMMALVARRKTVKVTGNVGKAGKVAVLSIGTLLLGGCSTTFEKWSLPEMVESLKADDDVPYADEFSRALYAGIGIGASRLEPDTSEVRNYRLNDRVEPAGQITVGADLTKHFALEFHSADLGSAGFSRNGGSGGGRINYHTDGVSALIYAGGNRHRFRRQGLTAFGRVGYGALENSPIGDVPFEKDNARHFLVGAGVEYMTPMGLGLRAEGISYDTDVKYAQLGVIYRTGSKQKIVKPALVHLPQPVPRPPIAAAVPPPPPSPLLPVTAPKPSICDGLYGGLEGVSFHTNSAGLTTDSTLILDDVAQTLNTCESLYVEVSAHTDSVGSANYNQILSERRAESVVSYLSTRGLKRERLNATAYGETSPIDSNETKSGRARNRRVELYVR